MFIELSPGKSTPVLQKPEGKQHGKIDATLRIHLWEYPENGAIATVLYIITTHYLYFAMLFMQLWGKHSRNECLIRGVAATSP